MGFVCSLETVENQCWTETDFYQYPADDDARSGLAFGEHSLMDRTFSRTGRELGLFVESRLSLGKLGFDLGAAVTSGDGRNSFGSSSTDLIWVG